MMTATAWFVLLIWQPRLATTGRLAQHRRNGLIGLFLAGGVVASSLLMLPGNIEAAEGLEDGGFVGATEGTEESTDDGGALTPPKTGDRVGPRG